MGQRRNHSIFTLFNIVMSSFLNISIYFSDNDLVNLNVVS